MKALEKLVSTPIGTGWKELQAQAAAELAALEAENAALTAEVERLQRVKSALINLFQACSDLCLDDMNKLDAAIMDASAALAERP